MKRFLVVIAILIGLAFVITLNDGTEHNFQIDWGDWHISIKPILLVIGLLVLVGALDFLWRILALLYTSPRKFRALFSRRAQRKMGETLHKSLLAMALDDRKTVSNSLMTLEAKDNHTPISQLVMYLSHQHLGTKDQIAPELVAALTQHDGADILVLKAQAEQAVAAGELPDALHVIDIILSKNSSLPWANALKLLVCVRQKHWDAALNALDGAVKSGVYTKSHGAQWKAALLTAQGYEETPQSINATRTKLIKTALKADPYLLPAIMLNVQDMIEKQELRGAAKAIETTWQRTPHPHLGQAYLTLKAGTHAADKLTRAQKLADYNPDHFESHILVAQAALLAGRADIFLSTLAHYTEHPTRRVCLLLHAYEHTRLEHSTAAREWLLKAVSAAPDAGWNYNDILAPHWGVLHPIHNTLCLPRWHSGAFTGSIMPTTELTWGTLKAVTLPSDASALLLENRP